MDWVQQQLSMSMGGMDMSMLGLPPAGVQEEPAASASAMASASTPAASSSTILSLSGSGPSLNDLNRFATTWGLETEAQSLLAGLTPAAQLLVMSKFAPLTESGAPAQDAAEVGRDCNGKFIMFAKNFASISPEVPAFIERWQLQEVAQDILMRLDQDSQISVMHKFAPLNEQGQPCNSSAEVGRDCNGKFIIFARSFKGKAKGKGGKGKEVGNMMEQMMGMFASFLGKGKSKGGNAGSSWGKGGGWGSSSSKGSGKGPPAAFSNSRYTPY